MTRKVAYAQKFAPSLFCMAAVLLATLLPAILGNKEVAKERFAQASWLRNYGILPHYANYILPLAFDN